MDIIRTKVFSKIDRSVAIKVLTRDLRQDMPVLFMLADDAMRPVSGCKRLLKALTSEYSGIQETRIKHRATWDGATLSNYSHGHVPFNEVDLATCVNGFGKRFPCQWGTIMTVQDLDVP